MMVVNNGEENDTDDVEGLTCVSDNDHYTSDEDEDDGNDDSGGEDGGSGSF